MRRENDEALDALRAKLEKVRQAAERAISSQAPGPDADATRQVYEGHIAWLEDKICEMENGRPEDTD